MDVGVVVGRFQVDELHVGHKALLNYVSTRHPNVVIVLGVPPWEGTAKDPLPYPLRDQMIRSYVPEATVLPLKDVKSDEQWSKNLDSLLTGLFFASDIKLYCGPDGFKHSYTGDLNIEQVKILDDVPKWSGSDIRRRIGDSPIHNQAFRAGLIHAAQTPYLQVKMCVDIVAVSSGGKILIGKKNHENGWRFPGGQVDNTDRCLEEAACRELFEETCLVAPNGWDSLEYLGSFNVQDWRCNGTGLSIITALFKTPITTMCAKASSDLDLVSWVDIDDTKESVFVQGHIPLFNRLKEVINEPIKVG